VADPDRVGQVGRDETRLAERPGDLGDDLLASPRIPAVRDDLGALPGQRDGGGAPDARGRSGDEGGLAAQALLTAGHEVAPTEFADGVRAMEASRHADTSGTA